MTARKNPYDAIRGRLRKGDGWMKKGMWDRNGDAGQGQTFCLVGAATWANAVQHRNRDERDLVFDILADVIAEQYPDRLRAADEPDLAIRIIDFNDHWSTQWPDVERVLDKAKIRWEEPA